MKTCSKCGVTKELSCYRVRDNGKHRNECTPCLQAINKEYLEKKREDPQWKDKMRERTCKSRQNLTPEQKKKKDQDSLTLYYKKRDEKENKFFAEHGISSSEHKRREKVAEFKATMTAKRGHEYSYELVDFYAQKDKVKIFCKRCSSSFLQAVKDHSRGKGCIQCGFKQTGAKLTMSFTEFVEKCKLKHGDKYSPIEDGYKNAQTKTNVMCNTCSSPFVITPSRLLCRNGCPYCAPYGFKKNKPASLYVLKSSSYVKVGVTNNDIQLRISQLNAGISGDEFVLQREFKYNAGVTAHLVEQKILKYLRSLYDQPQTKFNGSTECFYDVDIPQLLNLIEELS